MSGPLIQRFDYRPAFGLAPLSGEYTVGTFNSEDTTFGTYAADILHAVPMVIEVGFLVDGIGVAIDTGVDSSGFRLGLFNNNTALSAPGSLWIDAGTIDPNLAASDTAIVATITDKWINPGIYWAALNTDATGDAVEVKRSQNVGSLTLQVFGSTILPSQSIVATHTYGAFPATFPSAGLDRTNGGPPPRIFLRAA